MSEKEHLPYLDGWRGIAIALVLLEHFGGVYRPDMGRFGVELFFVLSGLLMSRILFEQRMPTGKFYRRRVSRILPVFLAFVAVCWIGWSDAGASWQELATTLTFTRAYFTHPTIWHSVLPDGNLWSLNIEEQCYVLLATVAAVSVLRRRAVWILLTLGLLTVPATQIHMHLHSQIPYYLTIECASAGLFLSAGYRLLKKWTAPAWLPVVALAGAFLTFAYGARAHLPIIVSSALLAVAVNHIQDAWRWFVRALEWRPLRQLGILSYSVYLWQELFIRDQAAFPYHTAVLVALGAGCASYYLFERPARQWLNTRWGAGSREAIPAPVAG